MALPDGWFRPLMIRPKLILAFVAMAVMTAFCGAVGYVFVDRIGKSVSVFAEQTSPLLSESIALAGNAERMRTVFLTAISRSDNPAQASQQLKVLHATGVAHLARLRELAASSGIDLKLDAVAQGEDRFLRVLEGALAARGHELTASAATKQRLDSFAEHRRSIEAMLLAVINRANGEINKREDRAKVEVQIGAATVGSLDHLLSSLLHEIFPMLQNAGRLLNETGDIDDAVGGLLRQVQDQAVQDLEQKIQGKFKTISVLTRKLAERLRDASGREEIARIRQGFAGLRSEILGGDGLIAGQREILAARAEVLRGHAALEARYLGSLDDIVQAVSGVNQAARQSAEQGIVQARTIIAGSVAFTLLAAVVLGLFFAHRISAPIMKLAGHAEHIGQGGELKPLPHAGVNGRFDEFGTLARAFNQMINELASARQRLIEWSEAEIKAQYERLNAAINNMPQGLCMFDRDQKLIICNERYSEIYSLPPELTVPGTPLRALFEDHVKKGATPDASQDFIAQRMAAISTREPYYFINEMRDGHVIAVSNQPIANGGSVTTHEDITERRKVEAKIAYMAHHDALTDLPNRLSFRLEMEKALAVVGRGTKLAVLCLDLDHFKSVNDTLGHPVGDALLQQVADRIRICVRPNDVIARLGGDEFAIVQLAVEQPAGAPALASRVIKELSEPFELNGHRVVIGASIGIAVAPDDGSDPDRLMKNADMALYRAKEDGRGVYRFFEPEMDAKMQLRRQLELDLRRAAAVGEFELYYQPTVQVDDEHIVSFEALLRWHHPERGLLLPETFIPLSEEIGLINSIGAWVLKEACRVAMTWPDDIMVSVNLSPVQFKNDALVLEVMAALGTSGLAARRLELEITETVLLQDTDETVNTLTKLRELGVRIAMDDFGTGYSSLGYLRKFPFDRIKIDRSFIRDVAEKPDSIAIVRAVAGLSSTLGMATTAEGVETKEQLAALKAEGCTEVQGFLFSEPKPARELSSVLQKLRASPRAVA